MSVWFGIWFGNHHSMLFELECCSANEWLNVLQTIFGQEPPVSSVQGWCSAPRTFGKQERFLAIAEKHEKVEHLCFWQSCLTLVYLNLISIIAPRDKWDVSCLDSFWIHTHMLRSTTNHEKSVRSAGACRATSVGQCRDLELGECPNRSDLKNQIMNIKLYQIISNYKVVPCYSVWCMSSYVIHINRHRLLGWVAALQGHIWLGLHLPDWCQCGTTSLIELHRSDFVVTELCHAGQAWCPEGSQTTSWHCLGRACILHQILALNVTKSQSNGIDIITLHIWVTDKFWYMAKGHPKVGAPIGFVVMATPRPSQYYFEQTWFCPILYEQIEPANSSKCKHLISAMIIRATLIEERVKTKEISRSMNARSATHSSP